MRLELLAVMALLLAGCGGNSPEAQCRRQAAQDPAVRAVYTRGNGYYTISTTPQQAELEQATRQAEMRCMREKGLAPPGGVQPVIPR